MPEETPKIPTFEEAKDQIGEDAISFLMDMVRQDDGPPEDDEKKSPGEEHVTWNVSVAR
jgi:hypothetical protein